MQRDAGSTRGHIIVGYHAAGWGRGQAPESGSDPAHVRSEGKARSVQQPAAARPAAGGASCTISACRAALTHRMGGDTAVPSRRLPLASCTAASRRKAGASMWVQASSRAIYMCLGACRRRWMVGQYGAVGSGRAGLNGIGLGRRRPCIARSHGSLTALAASAGAQAVERLSYVQGCRAARDSSPSCTQPARPRPRHCPSTNACPGARTAARCAASGPGSRGCSLAA